VLNRRIRPIGFLALLAWFSFLPLLRPAGSPLLRVFPASPSIPGLAYRGEFSYTQAYSPSGSQWAPGLDEREVFFASLRHSEDAARSWEIRLGKGGQLYSIRGPYGESQAPQTQRDAHWMDQIFQLVGVNRAENGTAPGHAYFVHQAGDYLRSPILTRTFYSPMLASDFSASSREATVLNWGQQAHIPNVHRAGLLYYERLKDLGSGVVEITYVVYNFGKDPIDYLNTPWGGVRKSALPITLAANADGSARRISASFSSEQFINLRDCGGWIAWTKDAETASSPALALVFGGDAEPRPAYRSAAARFRYGTGPPENDFEVVELDPFLTLAPGAAAFFRVYLVSGMLGPVQRLANELAPRATSGLLTWTADTADLLPIYRQMTGAHTVLTSDAPGRQKPQFYTFAQPIPGSVPLFVLREARSGELRLSTDPCELCTTVLLGSDLAQEPYDGVLQYAGFLGYVVQRQPGRRGPLRFEKLADRIRDRSYFPASGANRELSVVTAARKPHGKDH